MKTGKLWAPWRADYVQSKHGKGCIFCKAARGKADFVVFKSPNCLCMLNIFPYNNGHLMVAPLKHTADIDSLSDPETLELLQCVKKASGLLKKVLKPHGFNIGINISGEAGAGIPGHLHVHIVPRWKGDTNFMPVIFDTRVISQSLQELAKKLKQADDKADARR